MSKKTEGEVAFKEAYGALNAVQKQAVDTIEGPVMVIAGPGTGKTQILTLRIANILLKTDVKPSNILALTFTDSGAKAMRERLKSLIGEAAYDVGIYTFHGFADTVIARYPEAYTTIIGGRPASEVEKVQMIESILEDPAFKALRPAGDPSYYIRPIQKAIQTLKQEYITADTFAHLIEVQAESLSAIEQFHTKGAHKGKVRGEYKDAEKALHRNQELLQVYRRYESLLRDAKLYDFDDMIVETVKALETNQDMLLDLQEQYQYVLADEHQDVNGSQNKILELLVNFHDRPNLFVVGDEKQAIYRFQGASLNNFLYFDTAFTDSTTLSLTDNYRSGQTILDVAGDLIATDDEVLKALRVPLLAKAVKQSEVEQFHFAHEVVENAWLVSDIKAALAAGTAPSEITVIVRTNHEVEEYATALRKEGIAVAPSADSDILKHPITRSVFGLLRGLAKPTDEAGIVSLLHEPYWDISVEDLGRVLQQQNRRRPLSLIIRNQTELTEAGVVNVESVLRVGKCLDFVRAESSTSAPHRLLEQLLHDSGFLMYVMKHDPFEGARIVRRLFDEVEGMVKRGEVKSITDILRRLELHIQYNLSLNAPFIPSGGDAVHVMTAHKSKGLEFELVYIPHLSDKTWGKKKARELFTLPITRPDLGDFDVAEDDECRLLYVAMTRAKKRLVLSLSDLSTEGKEQVASRFLTTMAGTGISLKSTEVYSQQFSPVQDLKPLPVLPVTTTFMLEALAHRGFSPTALNNYLKSPWEYLYRNVLRVPQVKSLNLQFGTAVHAVLDTVVRDEITKGSVPSIGQVSELLKLSLNQEALSDEEYTRMHERGLSILSVYLDHLLATATIESKTEMKFEAELPTGIPEYPVLKLNGTLDRVDYRDGLITQVVDYKTGKPKTRGHIEGTTASSNGEYKRQLVFYALLLSLQSDSALHCRTGVLSFVEPGSHGEIKEEQFVITDEEIEELKKELIRVYKEIISGQALVAPCDPKMCHYCDLVEKLPR